MEEEQRKWEMIIVNVNKLELYNTKLTMMTCR